MFIDVSVCDGYDTTLTSYEGHYIDGYNVPKGLTSNEGISLEDCTRLCTANPDCLSFDFVETVLWCSLNYLSRKQAIDARVYSDGDGTMLYERNCMPEIVIWQRHQRRVKLCFLLPYKHDCAIHRGSYTSAHFI